MNISATDFTMFHPIPANMMPFGIVFLSSNMLGIMLWIIFFVALSKDRQYAETSNLYTIALGCVDILLLSSISICMGKSIANGGWQGSVLDAAIESFGIGKRL